MLTSREEVSTRPPKKRKFDVVDTKIKDAAPSILKSCIPLEKKVRKIQAQVRFDDKVTHKQTFGFFLAENYTVNSITKTLPLVDEHSATSHCPTKADLLGFEREIRLGKMYPDLLIAEDRAFLEEKKQMLQRFENLFEKPVIGGLAEKKGKSKRRRDNKKLSSGYLTETRDKTKVMKSLGTSSWQNPDEFELLIAELYQHAVNQFEWDGEIETPDKIEKMMVCMRDNICTQEVTSQELKDILFDYYYKRLNELPFIDGKLDMLEVEATLRKLIDVRADYLGNDIYVLSWSPISKKDVAEFVEKKTKQLAEIETPIKSA